jgi:hypothetical protein
MMQKRSRRLPPWLSSDTLDKFFAWCDYTSSLARRRAKQMLQHIHAEWLQAKTKKTQPVFEQLEVRWMPFGTLSISTVAIGSPFGSSNPTVTFATG